MPASSGLFTLYKVDPRALLKSVKRQMLSGTLYSKFTEYHLDNILILTLGRALYIMRLQKSQELNFPVSFLNIILNVYFNPQSIHKYVSVMSRFSHIDPLEGSGGLSFQCCCESFSDFSTDIVSEAKETGNQAFNHIGDTSEMDKSKVSDILGNHIHNTAHML